MSVRVLAGAICALAMVGAAVAAAVEQAGFPPPGARLVIERRSAEGSERTTWMVLDDSAHRGRAVHRMVSDSGYEFYDVQSKGWIATLRHGDLKEVRPHNGQLNGPLEEGASWRAEYRYRRADGSWSHQSRTWNVAARERIRVGAGEFDTLRIESPGERLSLTLWYAPQIGFWVRKQTRGMVNQEAELVEYRAAGGG